MLVTANLVLSAVLVSSGCGPDVRVQEGSPNSFAVSESPAGAEPNGSRTVGESVVSSQRWERLAEHAPYPEGYNWPVHVAADGRFVALHQAGTWVSRDGASWTRNALPFSGMNSAYLPYVRDDAGTWALGLLDGNYQRFTVDPVIQRTTDHESWTVVGRSTNLPQTVFHAAAAFHGALWIFGGWNGRSETADVWRSTDGLDWTLVTSNPGWSPRKGAKVLEFRGRLFLFGGGVLDGANSNEVWSTADGSEWRLETGSIAPEEPVGYSPIVFQDRIWLVGANRSGRFSSEMLVSDDGRTWTALVAPWSPRGGVATWTDGESLFLTGGKYSTVVDGEIRFEYRNDVWRMR